MFGFCFVTHYSGFPKLSLTSVWISPKSPASVMVFQLWPFELTGWKSPQAFQPTCTAYCKPQLPWWHKWVTSKVVLQLDGSTNKHNPCPPPVSPIMVQCYISQTLSRIWTPFGVDVGGSFNSSQLNAQSQSQCPRISPLLANRMRLQWMQRKTNKHINANSLWP